MADQPNRDVLVLPAFGKSPALTIEMDKIRNAESRYIEAKTVSPSSYSDLEHDYNESYRDLKRHISSVGYALTIADKDLRTAKANVILGSYAKYLEGKPKYADNTDIRDAYLMRDETYVKTLDRINQLKALLSNLEGKQKTVENVCKYMRQKMYLLSKSGVPMNIGVSIK